MKSKLLVFAATLAAPTAALAHPGHTVGSAVGRLHYLTDPYHLLVGLLAAVCVGALALGPLRRALARSGR